MKSYVSLQEFYDLLVEIDKKCKIDNKEVRGIEVLNYYLNKVISNPEGNEELCTKKFLCKLLGEKIV